MTDDKFIIFTPSDAADGEATGEETQEGRERRRHRRFRAGVLTEIHRRGRSGPFPGITYNLSRSGALLLTLASLQEGEQVELCFISNEKQRAEVQARVVYGAELKKDTFWSRGFGIEFITDCPLFLESELEAV
jgi:hypothetical protein